MELVQRELTDEEQSPDCPTDKELTLQDQQYIATAAVLGARFDVAPGPRRTDEPVWNWHWIDPDGKKHVSDGAMWTQGRAAVMFLSMLDVISIPERVAYLKRTRVHNASDK